MKIFIVLLTFITVALAGFMPPMVNKGFMPVAEEWHRSTEEYDDSEHYDQHHHDFEDYPKTVHVHEDAKHYDHHHFEDSYEYNPPAVVSHHHEHPKAVHIHEKPEVHIVKEPQLVHVHEHHHHHHHHVKTLPISIIKKTVYIKHG